MRVALHASDGTDRVEERSGSTYLVYILEESCTCPDRHPRCKRRRRVECELVIAPTSMASSYFLTQHGLTAIPIDELPLGVRSQLADELDEPIETFDLIQLGK